MKLGSFIIFVYRNLIKIALDPYFRAFLITQSRFPGTDMNTRGPGLPQSTRDPGLVPVPMDALTVTLFNPMNAWYISHIFIVSLIMQKKLIPQPLTDRDFGGNSGWF